VPAPVDLRSVLLTALLNPVVVIVAFWMGATANQWQKLPLAAFAGAVAGMAAVYLAIRLGVTGVAGTSRAAAGVFTAQLVLALIWAYAGYRLARRPS
jgi:hypothetical protein